MEIAPELFHSVLGMRKVKSHKLFRWAVNRFINPEVAKLGHISDELGGSGRRRVEPRSKANS
jgi:hypothetical protein